LLSRNVPHDLHQEGREFTVGQLLDPERNVIGLRRYGGLLQFLYFLLVLFIHCSYVPELLTLIGRFRAVIVEDTR
jgi:hypothetical protein